MNNIEMRGICYRCEHYRPITYSDGSGSVGCVKDSPTGYPVDIRNMECCPVRKDGHGFRKLALPEIMAVLNQLYIMCSSAPAEFSLVDVVEMTAGDTIKGRRTAISQAVRDLQILSIVERNGKKYSYRWNMKKWGPASMEVAQAVASQVYLRINEQIEKQRQRRIQRAEDAVTRPAKVKKEATRCDSCKLKDQAGCRDILLKLGIDCKVYDVNSLKIVDDNEASVGRQGEA